MREMDSSLYEENELIIFDDGLFGFESYKRFLPLPMEENNNDFLCLVSVEDETLSFIIINPFTILADYNPILTADEMKKLEVSEDKELSFYSICVVGDTAQNSTVNLKCPIVVNAKTRKAMQVILTSGNYNFRHTLSALKREGE